MIGLLIEAGADTDAKNNQGKTAEEVAELNGNMEAAQAIRVLATAKAARRAGGDARRRAGNHEPMTPPRFGQMLRSFAQAAAIAVALCFGGVALAPFLPGLMSTANATSERDFTEEDVNAAVEEGDRRALQGRRLRVPRSEAQRRSQSRLREDQDRARHGRLWLVRQHHLPRQGQRPRSNTPSTSGSSRTARS